MNLSSIVIYYGGFYYSQKTAPNTISRMLCIKICRKLYQTAKLLPLNQVFCAHCKMHGHRVRWGAPPMPALHTNQSGLNLTLDCKYRLLKLQEIPIQTLHYCQIQNDCKRKLISRWKCNIIWVADQVTQMRNLRRMITWWWSGWSVAIVARIPTQKITHPPACMAQHQLSPSQSSCMAMVGLLPGHLIDLARPTETGQGEAGRQGRSKTSTYKGALSGR